MLGLALGLVACSLVVGWLAGLLTATYVDLDKLDAILRRAWMRIRGERSIPKGLVSPRNERTARDVGKAWMQHLRAASMTTRREK